MCQSPASELHVARRVYSKQLVQCSPIMRGHPHDVPCLTWRSQPARAHPIDMSATTISIGGFGAQVEFDAWDSAVDSDEDLDNTRTFAVAVFNSTTSGARPRFTRALTMSP